MNQIESNIINSFKLAKHDIHMLKGQMEHLANMQEKIIETIKEIKEKQDSKISELSHTKTTTRKKTIFVASKTAKKFHKENCPFAQNIKPKSKLKFLSKIKALNEGYKPCKCVTSK